MRCKEHEKVSCKICFPDSIEEAQHENIVKEGTMKEETRREMRKFAEEMRGSKPACSGGLNSPVISLRIMTNGEKYKVQKTTDGKEWTDDGIDYTSYNITLTQYFKSYKKAKRWVEENYGKKAPLQPREWRAV